jgi:hypothetical protein
MASTKNPNLLFKPEPQEDFKCTLLGSIFIVQIKQTRYAVEDKLISFAKNTFNGCFSVAIQRDQVFLSIKYNKERYSHFADINLSFRQILALLNQSQLKTRDFDVITRRYEDFLYANKLDEFANGRDRAATSLYHTLVNGRDDSSFTL